VARCRKRGSKTTDRLKVIEYSSFFAVGDRHAGQEHPMGDGVDTLFDAEGKAMSPGTAGFVEE
jgi:hypothetical protein